MTAAVHRVLRDDDPAVPPLLAAGWLIAHRSWAARLQVPDRAVLTRAVGSAEAAGHHVAELGPEDDLAVGELVAVTAIRDGDERAETDFTCVAAAHRGRGLAQAVKAASVLALMDDGTTAFGTGGAAENAASPAMNARLGYVVTERWLTLLPPV